MLKHENTCVIPIFIVCCCSHLVCFFCVGSMFCGVVLGVLSSLAINLLRKRELVALLCVVAVCVLCLFLKVLWVGLQSVIVTFLGQTHLLFDQPSIPLCVTCNSKNTCLDSINFAERNCGPGYFISNL